MYSFVFDVVVVGRQSIFMDIHVFSLLAVAIVVVVIVVVVVVVDACPGSRTSFFLRLYYGCIEVVLQLLVKLL